MENIIKQTLNDMGIEVHTTEVLELYNRFECLWRVMFSMKDGGPPKYAAFYIQPGTGPIEILSVFYNAVEKYEEKHYAEWDKSS